jgi:hypothetical protein
VPATVFLYKLGLEPDLAPFADANWHDEKMAIATAIFRTASRFDMVFFQTGCHPSHLH